MHAPALGSAAATLAVSLIYLVSPPAPDARVRVAQADSEAPRAVSSPVGTAAADRLVQGHDYCAARCEVPLARASEHWMKYLELRRVAAPAVPDVRPGEKAKLPSS